MRDAELQEPPRPLGGQGQRGTGTKGLRMRRTRVLHAAESGKQGCAVPAH